MDWTNRSPSGLCKSNKQLFFFFVFMFNPNLTLVKRRLIDELKVLLYPSHSHGRKGCVDCSFLKMSGICSFRCSWKNISIKRNNKTSNADEGDVLRCKPLPLSSSSRFLSFLRSVFCSSVRFLFAKIAFVRAELFRIESHRSLEDTSLFPMNSKTSSLDERIVVKFGKS